MLILAFTKVASYPLLSGNKDLLLQNEKLLQVHKRKIQILAAIHASLPAVAEKAVLPAGVPGADVAVITGMTTNSSEGSGGVMPQSPGLM